MKRWMLSAAFLVFLVGGGLLVGCTTEEEKKEAGGPGAAAPIARVAEKPVLADGVLVAAKVSDLSGFIEKTAGLAAQVSPGLTAQSLKAMAGGRYGDPQLQGFPPGAGIVVFLPDFQSPIVVAEVDPAQVDAYQEALKQRNIASEVVDGLLVGAATPDQLPLGKELATGTAAALLRGEGTPTLEITANLPEIFGRYGQTIDGGLEFIVGAMKQSVTMASGQDGVSTAALRAQTRMAEAEMRELLSLARQVKALHFSVRFPEDNLLLEKIVIPLPDTNLAVLLGAACPAFPEDLMKLVPGNGILRGGYSWNPKAMTTFIEKEGVVLLERMGEDPEALEGIMGWIEKWVTLAGDQFAMDFMLPEGPMISGSMIGRVQDPEKALEALESMQEDFASSGIGDLYASMGMPMTFSLTRNVRQYEEIPIHRLSIAMEMGALPPEARGSMEKLLGPMEYEIALVGDLMLYAAAPQTIESLIDAAKAGEYPQRHLLVARTALDPGGRAYFDFDLGRYLEFFVLMIQDSMQGEVPEVFSLVIENLRDAPPLALAVAIEPELLHGYLLVPKEVFVGIGKATQEQPPAGGN